MAIDLGSTGININPPVADDAVVRAEQNRLVREIKDLAERSRIPWTSDEQLLQEIKLRGDRLQRISPAPPAIVKHEHNDFYSRALRQRDGATVAVA